MTSTARAAKPFSLSCLDSVISTLGLAVFFIVVYRDIRHLAATHHTRAFTCSCFQLSKDATESEQSLHSRRDLMLLHSDTAHLSTDSEFLVSRGPRWHRVKIRRRQCLRHFQRSPCNGLVPKWDFLVCSSSSTWLANGIQLKPCRAA